MVSYRVVGNRVVGSPILVDSSITVNVIITTLLALLLLPALRASAEKWVRCLRSVTMHAKYS